MRLAARSEYIDMVYHDAERMGVLASDGTADDILGYVCLGLDSPTLFLFALLSLVYCAVARVNLQHRHFLPV
jgi:hypothetical protein